jgi:hypothetical protein
MSKLPDNAVTYIFSWHSMGDACPKCAALNGQDFQDQDIYQETLWHPIWGDIWDLVADHSLAHPNCRCSLEVRVKVNWDQLRETGQLQNYLNSPEFKAPNEISMGVIDLSSVTEVKSQLDEVTSKISGLEEKSGRAELSLRQEIHTLTIMLSAVELATGNKNVDAAVQKMHQLIQVAMRVRMLLLAVQELEAGTLGPFGWLYAGAIGVSTLISASQLGQ